MRRHRTTARGAPPLLLLAALCTGAASAGTGIGGSAAGRVVKPGAIVFPIVGTAKYGDDYGDPRPNGHHAGIDIVTSWRSAAVAAEDGRIRFWTTSARAGCMLYLYGASGTSYQYIHLNNDVTSKRDNRGSCVAGVAYADGLKDGARVKAGQQIAYNGDSGDAEGTTHLHFEVHPGDGADVDPFPYLNEATRLLFALPAQRSRMVTLGLRGVPVSAGAGVLELSVTAVRVWPGGKWTAIEARPVELGVPDNAELDASVAQQLLAPTRRALASLGAPQLTVFTWPTKVTPDVMAGAPGTLSAERVRAS
jgi:hypothetical protein